MRRRIGAIFNSPRRRRASAILALLVAVVVTAAVVLHASRPANQARHIPDTLSGSVKVQRRNLVETDTESGTIGYADPQTVYNQLSGTITWLPQVGEVIKSGQTLFRVDGQPVLLMYGSTPAYRNLEASDTPGIDIEQLNRNLVRLGLEPEWITIDDQWQPGTTAGVKLMQERLGEDETGRLSLGRVVFLPGDQVISSLEETVGSTGAGGSSTAILQTSSTQLIVTVDLDASSQSEAKVGASVTVELPSGKTVDGVITAVSSVAESLSSTGGSAGSSAASSGSSTSSVVPVTIKLKGRHRRSAGLDQASVSVNFTQAEARHVLSVPVTALIATAGGGYAVQEANAPYRRLPVTTGLFAAGYVQIVGHGIHSDLRVTSSQG